MLLSRKPAWFMASYAMPPVMAPSPMTAITLLRLPLMSRPTAMPSPAEMDVDEWPAPKASWSLSERLVNPERPPDCRMVDIRDLRGRAGAGRGLDARAGMPGPERGRRGAARPPRPPAHLLPVSIL